MVSQINFTTSPCAVGVSAKRLIDESRIACKPVAGKADQRSRRGGSQPTTPAPRPLVSYSFVVSSGSTAAHWVGCPFLVAADRLNGFAFLPPTWNPVGDT